MGIFQSDPKWMQNPNAAGAPGQGGYLGLEDFADNVNLGHAGKAAWKKIMSPMLAGDYSGLVGGLLSPIHDRYATNLRESERNALSGGNAMYAGTQPALMQALQDQQRKSMAEGEGLAYGQAIPSLWESAAHTYQGALDSKRQEQLQAYQSALQGRLNSGQFVPQKSLMDKIGQVVGIASQVGGMAMGIPGLGGGSAGPAASQVSSYGAPPPPPGMMPSWAVPAPPR